ncbi:MAG TPA: hypothetical protein VFT13_03510, partial [Candidatus Krumholzibacteria bacterium]|nr:hypothetical protein [Candidatus Krumholzibacteria bacterium]
MRSAAFVLLSSLLITAAPVHARDPQGSARAVSASPARTSDRGDAARSFLAASVAYETTVLYQASFDASGSCTEQGWTSVDLTAQEQHYFHVDDYAGLNPGAFSPLAGTKSLWCGGRLPSLWSPCDYTFAGYGNNWDQAIVTKDCIPVSGDGVLDMTFIARFASEPSYDFTTLEYTLDCTGETGWVALEGGVGVWDGTIPAATYNRQYNIGTTGPVKIRFRFVSDYAWSPQDGLAILSGGGAHIDNLAAEGLLLEDFEDEAVNATEADDWESWVGPGYGAALALFAGAAQVQEDPCVRNLSCIWAALAGSTVTYACGGWPGQTAVPFKNADNRSLINQIQSPDIPLIGTGSDVVIEFSVYRDLPSSSQVRYRWGVRTV